MGPATAGDVVVGGGGHELAPPNRRPVRLQIRPQADVKSATEFAAALPLALTMCLLGAPGGEGSPAKSLISWCRRTGSNCRPQPYQYLNYSSIYYDIPRNHSTNH